ncbi:MAG: NAD-dependent epimerase/dehydratase family protein [Deltaproteobacteria bacterium]|nr:NAD-dependent epimerase/dehydratase family protein [Deltaproteobacteria bacterium]
MSKPLCLVTGACGFMGTHMVERLVEAGYPVRATDLESAYGQDDRKAGRFPSVIKDLDVDFVGADLTDPDAAAKAVEGVKWVFHIAGLFKYSATYEALEAVNVGGTRNLLDAALGNKKLERFIMWGAGGVYGLNPAKLPLTEDMVTDPPNNYLKTKDMAEKLVMERCTEKKISHAVLRPTTVYGPRGVYGGGQMIMQLAKMNPVLVPSNFTGRVPFVHVTDVVGAALHLAERGDSSGPYNVNDDSTMTQVEMMRYFALMSGAVFVKLPPVPVEYIKAGLGKVADVVQYIARDMLHVDTPLEADTVRYLNLDFLVSNDKLKKTGYEFIYPDARHGLRDTVHWYREQGWM